jgi:hypothetical protein
MQTNSAIMSVFILFPAGKGWVMNCADGETLVTKILAVPFTVVCLILFTIWHHLHNSDPTGNKITLIPTPSMVLLVNSPPNKAGLHKK